MNETTTPERVCLDCDADISERHFNAKRCEQCAERSAGTFRNRGRSSVAECSCPDCGGSMIGRRSNAKRCAPCASDAALGHAPGQAAAQRFCIDCSLDISGRHFNAKRCEPCVDVEALRSRERYTKLRATLMSPTTRTCLDCRIDISGRSRAAKRCEPCAKLSIERDVQRTSREWRLANPWRCRTYCANRRERKRGSEGSVGVLDRDWVRVLRRYDSRCAYCGIKPKTIHMDHVVPLARGGRHSIGNVLPACQQCNQSKAAMFLFVWKTRARREAAAVA